MKILISVTVASKCETSNENGRLQIHLRVKSAVPRKLTFSLWTTYILQGVLRSPSNIINNYDYYYYHYFHHLCNGTCAVKPSH